MDKPSKELLAAFDAIETSEQLNKPWPSRSHADRSRPSAAGGGGGECKMSRKWEEWPEVKWDEQTALVIFDSDTYIFDPDDLRDYLEDNNEPLEEIKFQMCQKERPPTFEIKEFLYDHLGEWIDNLPPTDPIDRIVNEWIKEHAPTMWTPISARPSLQSLKDAVGD